MGSDADILKRFGKKVRAWRTEKSLSQEKLAEKCNLDRTYISGIERGVRNVGLKNIEAIAKALEIEIQDLFDGI